MRLSRPHAAWFVAAVLFAAAGCGLPGSDEVTGRAGPSGPCAALFEIDGPLPSFPSSQDLFSPTGTSQHRLLDLLVRAASDLRVQEVVVHIGSPEVSLARAGEIADAIRRVAAAGKPVSCHLEDADNVAYYLAARGCPRIAISPAGSLDLVGLSVEAVFLREMLASLGMTADILSVGKYKDAAEPLTSDAMSPASREATNDLLDDLSRSFEEGIATGRKLDPATMRALIDGGPYSASEARARGLVDEIRTLGEHIAELRGKYPGGVADEYGKEPPKPLSLGDLFKLIGGQEPEPPPAGPRVAIVPAVGPIVSGNGDDLLAGVEIVSDTELVDALDKAGRDESVKAVVLRVDSPGGSALASDNIWVAVKALSARKPVVASMGEVAASGGYYVASAATEIVASGSTLTGSIGVVGGKIVVEGTLGKVGVKSETIDRGARASMSSPLRPFTSDERRAVERLMRGAYDLFVDRVAEGRRLDRARVLAAAEGRVWTGAQAARMGLVDRVGGMHEALARARELGKLPVTAPAEIFPRPKTFFEILGERLAEPQAVVLARRLPGGRWALCLAALLSQPRPLAIAPVFFEIR